MCRAKDAKTRKDAKKIRILDRVTYSFAPQRTRRVQSVVNACLRSTTVGGHQGDDSEAKVLEKLLSPRLAL